MFKRTTHNGSPISSRHPVEPLVVIRRATLPKFYPIHRYPKHSTYNACPRPRTYYDHLFRRTAKQLINFGKPRVVREARMPQYWEDGYIPRVYTSDWDPRMRLTAYEIFLRWVRKKPIKRRSMLLHWLWGAKKAGAEPGMIQYDWHKCKDFGHWSDLKQLLLQEIKIEQEKLRFQDYVFDGSASLSELAKFNSEYDQVHNVAKDEGITDTWDEDMEGDVWLDFASGGLPGLRKSCCLNHQTSELREIDNINELNKLDWEETVRSFHIQTGIGYDLESKVLSDYAMERQIDDDDDVMVNETDV